MSRNPRILIIRFSSIGDIILTAAFIRQTRLKFPRATLDYVIKKQFSDLIKDNPHIDNVFELDTDSDFESLKNLSQTLKKNQYDFVFDLHANLRSAYLCKQLKKTKIFKIKKNKIKRSLLVFSKINLYKTILSVPEKYLNTGKNAGIKDDGKGLELFWRSDVEKSLTAIFQKEKITKKNYIVIAPGAGFYTKQWPAAYVQQFIELFLKKYHHKIVLLGSAAESVQNDYFLQNDRVINLSGKLSLLQSAIVISNSVAVLSNDSGLMHMAVAVRAPLLAIFGSTTQELGFFPYKSNATVIETEGLWCRPCSHIGRDNCPLNNFKCMMNIQPKKVMNHFSALIESK
jgi:heptosyltransferase-2